MRRLHTLTLPTLLLTMLTAGTAHATPWTENMPFSDTENASLPSCKVDAADLNGDGNIDLVFANTGGTMGGDPDSPLAQQAFMNNGDGTFTDVSATIFGGAKFTGRSVKLRDIDYDDDIDIILGTTWISQSQLFINDGLGNFTNETAMNLPQVLAGVGDLEVGDADDDGDLDIVLLNWGDDPETDEVVNAPSAGGRTLLWSQMGDPEFGDPGTGMFDDVTSTNMPPIDLRVGWDVEFYDIDNDYQLDIITSCKWCYTTDQKSLYLYKNDGQGGFSDSPIDPALQGIDGHDLEIIDLNNDQLLDLVTLHDHKTTPGRNRVLLNDNGTGFTFADALWDVSQNPATQDYSASFYDFDSDGDPDIVLGALKFNVDRPDRLMVNDNGTFVQYDSGKMGGLKFQALEDFSATFTSGTCSMVLADLFDNDHKLDVAMSQYDVVTDKVVYKATAEVAEDLAPPIINNYQTVPDPLEFDEDSPVTVRLRVHDNKTPLMIHDFQKDGVYMEGWTVDPNPDPDANPGDQTPAQWYGEYLWRITFDVPDADTFWYRYCAIDAAGNKVCTPVMKSEIIGGGETTTSATATATESDTANTNTISDSDTSNSNSISDSMTETDSDSLSGPTDSNSNTESDSASDSQPTDTFGSNSMTETDSSSNSNTNSDTETDSNSASDTSNQLDDDGCGCDADDGPSGALASLALLGLLGIRRRRR